MPTRDDSAMFRGGCRSETKLLLYLRSAQSEERPRGDENLLTAERSTFADHFGASCRAVHSSYLQWVYICRKARTGQAFSFRFERRTFYHFTCEVMGNLITTVGQDSDEGGANQLLVSTRDEQEASGGTSLSARQQGDSSARNSIKAMAQDVRTELRQAPSSMSLSLASRASLVPRRTAHERATEEGGVWTRGRMLDNPGRGQTNHNRSSRLQPRAAALAPTVGAALRRTIMAAAERSPSSSPSGTSSLSPVPELSAPASPSDERRMLPRPRLSVQMSAPEVHCPMLKRVDGLPVDAVVNAAAPPQLSDGPTRRQQMKRRALQSGLLLLAATIILTVFAWGVLQEPLGRDVGQKVSYIARFLVLLRGNDASSGDGTVRMNGSLAAVNGSASALAMMGAKPA
ncbi:hypothetical protein HPB50_025468 [Hyalomma asiaticum]|uniref:Uncharacterized protein n=1 Tax=Hyalomma asiaticum TaxID=266040 RepID=A0ACB7SCS7_HYAAI|nr:hypothetical protein HPB50_025468 [Hyalomma asiaticum]